MRILFCLCLIVLFGCSKSADTIPAGLEYFPNIQLLEKGIVFKYYYHKGKKSAQPKTDILYHKMILKNGLITKEIFNAGFQNTRNYQTKIEGSKWKIIKDVALNYRNDHTELFTENAYTYTGNVQTDWEHDEAVLEKKIMYDGYGSRQQKLQIAISDSTSKGKSMKIFRGKRIYYSIIDDEENEPIEFRTYKRYEEDLGMTHSTLENNKFKYEMVLDEIMTLDEFDRRANHGTHRVAYIDTSMTLDDHTLFQPCFHQAKINDYYNDKRSGFKGGKGRLRALLKEKLDPSKIKDESGYLTFRFVVNCKGEAGWFVTEEADLDYQKKLFSDQCRNHLFEIIRAEKEWVNLRIGKQARDAYTYLTFKIKDGEIIEILP